MTSKLWWYTARSSGLVGWGLLAASMLWGLALTTKALGRRARPAWVLDLHRFLGAAALVFTTVHVVSIMLDSYVHFGLVEVLVPFAGTWHPVAVAWGIVAVYLLLAIEVTSLLRDRIPARLWRATHYASFPLFALVSVHTLSAGTDRHSGVLQLTVVALTAAIAVMTIVRVHRGPRTPEATFQPLPRSLSGRRSMMGVREP